MNTVYHHVTVEHRDGVFCVRLRNRRLEEAELADMADELVALVKDEGCRKMTLSLGPQPPLFLYSVFLARLVTLQRLLQDHEGSLVLCEAAPEVLHIFEACKLDTQFRFARDFDEAVALLR